MTTRQVVEDRKMSSTHVSSLTAVEEINLHSSTTDGPRGWELQPWAVRLWAVRSQWILLRLLTL